MGFARICKDCEPGYEVWFDPEMGDTITCPDCGGTNLRRLTGEECNALPCFQNPYPDLDYIFEDVPGRWPHSEPSFEDTQREYHGVSDPDNPDYED